MATDGERFELWPGEEGYPQWLMDDMEKPPVLYGMGNPDAIWDDLVAVAGARRCTPYGAACAELAARAAVSCGATVLTGAALGCDTAAARAAIGAGGRTVVFAACGPDVTYPPSSSDVFDEARDGRGCVISVEPWGKSPTRYAFPRRNSVLVALADCLVITEAGLSSGTTMMAEKALDIGITVMAIPGSIFSPQSVGTNRLVAEGAQVVCDERDLEQSIANALGRESRVKLSHARVDDPMLAALVACPMRPQELAERMDMGVMEVMRTLADYESAGLVERLPDGRYAATRRTLLGRDAARGVRPAREQRGTVQVPPPAVGMHQ